MESPPSGEALRSLHFVFKFISTGGKRETKGLEVQKTTVLLWDHSGGS